MVQIKFLKKVTLKRKDGTTCTINAGDVLPLVDNAFAVNCFIFKKDEQLFGVCNCFIKSGTAEIIE